MFDLSLIHIWTVCLAVFCLPFEVFAASSSSSGITKPLPRITSYEVSLDSISYNTSFEGIFAFYHEFLDGDADFQNIEEVGVEVSGNGITIGKDSQKFRLKVVKNDTSSPKNIQFTVQIPEKDMTYKSKQGGSLEFKLTYYNNKGEKIQGLGTPKVKKTISQCVKESNSSNDDDDQDEPNDPVGNVFFIPQDVEMPVIQAGTTGRVNIPIKNSLLYSFGSIQEMCIRDRL